MVKSLKISTLYIEVDDSYHYLKNSVSAEKVRNRMVAIHAGKDKNRVIIGKTILLESKILSQNHLNNYEMSMLIKQKIIENYGRQKFDLQVIGDGVRWIKGISKLINASYIFR